MKKVLFIFLTISLLLMTSCQSIALVVKSGVSGVPLWVNKLPEKEGVVYFVGRGVGETLSQAKGEAINNMLASVSNALGTDITGKYFSSMMTNESVEEAGLSLVDDYNRLDLESNVYIYYVLSSATEENLSKVRESEYNRVLEREKTIEELLEKAKESYKKNNDVQSVIYCLEAVIVSSEGRMDYPEYQYTALIDKATEYLSNIKLKLSDKNDKMGTVKVRLVRDKGLFHPNITNALVTANFPLSGYEGKRFSLTFKTGEDGIFNFSKSYSPMANEGTVIFYLDFSSWIEKAEKYIDSAAFEKFNSVNDKIRGDFVYSKTSYINDGELVICIGEYDSKGKLLDSTYAQEAIKSYFVNEGIYSACVKLKSEDKEAILEEVKQDYPEAKYLIWGMVGATDIYAAPTGNDIRTAEGISYFFRLSDGYLIASDDHIKSLSWADEDEVFEDLFTSYGKDLAANFTNYL